MRVLVLAEVDDLDQPAAVAVAVAVAISPDEPVPRQLGQQRLHVDHFQREQLHLDAPWPVLQPPLAVRQGPEANEAQARPGRAIGQLLVLEEAGFDVAGAGHQRTPWSAGSGCGLRWLASLVFMVVPVG